MRKVNLLALILPLAACGESRSGDDQPVVRAPPAGSSGEEAPPAPHAADCASLWTDLVASNEAGTVKEYETRSGSVSLTVRETVVDATPAAITTEVVTADVPSVSTLSREQFLETCRSRGPTPLPTSPDGVEYKVETLVSRPETRGVRAGRFQTDYRKVEMTGSYAEDDYLSISESWVTRDARRLLVESRTETTIARAGKVREHSETRTELTRLGKP